MSNYTMQFPGDVEPTLEGDLADVLNTAVQQRETWYGREIVRELQREIEP